MCHKSSLMILALTLLSLTIHSVKSTSTTSMLVQPETCYVAGIEQTFTINITVADVIDLWGWEFKLFYNSTQLNGTTVEEGPFLQTTGETFFWAANFTDNYNATHGYVYAFCILTHVIPGANGNGTLAKITFRSKTYGTSILDLTDTKMKNSEGEYMPHETRDGTIVVKLSGDFDCDGDVDSDDVRFFLRAWIDYWFHPPLDPEYEVCDFNGDGKMTSADVKAFLRAWIDYWF